MGDLPTRRFANQRDLVVQSRFLVLHPSQFCSLIGFTPVVIGTISFPAS
jgi:hypothetical protein